MAQLKIAKVTAIPGTLVADTIYLTRSADGFDLSVTDNTGTINRSLNTAFATPFASRAAAIATTIPAAMTQLTLIHNGMLLTYVRDATGTALTTNSGAVNWAPAGDVWLEHYGITPAAARTTATTDYTTELQAALTATAGALLFSGWVKLTNKVTVPLTCWPYCPEGRVAGGFRIESDFNLSATSVVELTAGERSAGFGPIGYSFAHTAATADGLRASLVNYPWALDMKGATRAVIDDLRIEGGWNGINGNGNCGGARFGVVELSCFNENIAIDGPLDFVHVESIEVWPFGFASVPNLTNLFYDGTPIGLNFGSCDGWTCDKLASFKVRSILDRGADDVLPAFFGVIQNDGDGANLEIKSGRNRIGALYATTTTAPTGPTIAVTGGITSVGQANIAGGATRDILVSGGTLAIEGGEIYNNSLSKTSMEVTGGTLAVLGARLAWATTPAARTAPFITQSGTGQLIVRDCYTPHKTYASEIIEYTTDVAGAYADIRGMRPHTMTFSTGWTSGTYQTDDNQNSYATGSGMQRLRKIGTGEGYEIGFELAGGTAASRTAVSDGSVLGDVSFAGFDGTSYTTAAYWRALSVGTPSSGIVRGKLRALIRNAAGTNVTPLDITEDGVTITGRVNGTAAAKLGPLLCTVGGTANAITLTYGQAALATGQMVRFVAASANTGATTINLDGLGAVACRTITGVALPADYIRTDVETVARYDGTYWVVDRQIERGSNINGDFVRLADGSMRCAGKPSLAFDAAARLLGTWTFPAAYIDADTKIHGMLNFDDLNANTAPKMEKISGIFNRNPTTTAVVLAVYRISGMTDFIGGNTVSALVTATGRWY